MASRASHAQEFTNGDHRIGYGLQYPAGDGQIEEIALDGQLCDESMKTARINAAGLPQHRRTGINECQIQLRLPT